MIFGMMLVSLECGGDFGLAGRAFAFAFAGKLTRI